jgi:uncharacterized RDD family membrane protein YckC
LTGWSDYMEYADWYVWAKRNLSSEPAVCHGAAAAAAQVIAAGGTREQAIAAARQSMVSGGHLTPEASDVRRRSYAEWFDWARRELGGVREQQHDAARAALAALDAGLGANQATQAARSVYGGGDAPAPAPAPAYPQPPPAPALRSAAPAGWAAPPPAFAAPVPAAPATTAFAGPASFGRRLVAFLLDSVLIFGFYFLLSVVIGFGIGVGAAVGGNRNIDTQQLDWVAVAILGITAVFAWAYSTIPLSQRWQATLGKRALGLAVVDESGRRISWGRANARFFASWLSALLCYAGYLVPLFNPRRQALHDLIAGTLVFRRAL